MKHINFSFDNADVKAISQALSCLPAYDAYDSFPPNLVAMPASVIMKLNCRERLSHQELYLIAIAVDSAHKALRGELIIEDEALRTLRQYFFTINKLQPSLSVLLDPE